MTSKKKLEVYNWLSSILPDLGIFRRIRKKVLRWCGVVIPSNVDLCGTARFMGDGEIIIGENSIIRNACFFHVSGGGRIELGRKVKLAENLIIESLANPAEPSSVRDITISEGCWICAGVIIVPGVTVGKRNVIAAGAVVTKNSPCNVLLAGVPAVIKKYY